MDEGRCKVETASRVRAPRQPTPQPRSAAQEHAPSCRCSRNGHQSTPFTVLRVYFQATCDLIRHVWPRLHPVCAAPRASFPAPPPPLLAIAPSRCRSPTVAAVSIYQQCPRHGTSFWLCYAWSVSVCLLASVLPNYLGTATCKTLLAVLAHMQSCQAICSPSLTQVIAPSVHQGTVERHPFWNIAALGR
jgi:hypothetical protein